MHAGGQTPEPWGLRCCASSAFGTLTISQTLKQAWDVGHGISLPRPPTCPRGRAFDSWCRGTCRGSYQAQYLAIFIELYDVIQAAEASSGFPTGGQHTVDADVSPRCILAFACPLTWRAPIPFPFSSCGGRFMRSTLKPPPRQSSAQHRT